MTLATAPAVERPEQSIPAAPAESTRHRLRPTAALGLGGLIVLALALRLEGISTWYWFDEALTIGLARHDLLDIPELLLRDGSPPLWYLLLHGWTAAFGTTVTATHALSVVFAVATVPVAWIVARRLYGERAAWMASALAAVSPFVTYFGRETRMYSLVVLLGLVVAGSFVEAFVDRKPRAEWVFAAALLALLYTHNWGLYTAAACGLALVPVWLASDDRRGLSSRVAVAFGAVTVGYLPWVPVLLSQIENTGAPWSYTPSFREVVREVAALYRDERVLAGLVPAAGYGLVSVVRRWPSRDALAASSLVVLAVVPVSIGWALAHVEPSWATRYLAVIVGPLLLLVGVGLARAGWVGVAALALAIVLITQPLTRLSGFPLPADVKSNGHGVAERMAGRLAPGDLVIVAQPEAVPLMALELGPGFTYADPTGVVADPSLMDWRDAHARLRAARYGDDVAPLVDRLSPGQRVLLVLPGNEVRRTDTEWIQLFRAKGRSIVRALRADRRLEIVDRTRGSGRQYVTVDAVLFERVE